MRPTFLAVRLAPSPFVDEGPEPARHPANRSANFRRGVDATLVENNTQGASTHVALGRKPSSGVSNPSTLFQTSERERLTSGSAKVASSASVGKTPEPRLWSVGAKPRKRGFETNESRVVAVDQIGDRFTPDEQSKCADTAKLTSQFDRAALPVPAAD